MEKCWESVQHDHCYAATVIKEEPFEDSLHSEIIIKDEIKDEYEGEVETGDCLDPYFEGSNIVNNNIENKSHTFVKSHECRIVTIGPLTNSNQNLSRENKLKKNRFECNHCGHSFINVSNLQRHQKEYCVGTEPDIECRCCKKIFLRRQDLFKHICDKQDFAKIYTHSNLQAFNCNICKKTFSNKLSVMAHEIKEHDGEKSFICDICEQTFFGKSEIIRHNNKQHPSNKLPKFHITWKRRNKNLFYKKPKPYSSSTFLNGKRLVLQPNEKMT